MAEQCSVLLPPVTECVQVPCIVAPDTAQCPGLPLFPDCPCDEALTEQPVLHQQPGQQEQQQQAGAGHRPLTTEPLPEDVSEEKRTVTCDRNHGLADPQPTQPGHRLPHSTTRHTQTSGLTKPLNSQSQEGNRRLQNQKRTPDPRYNSQPLTRWDGHRCSIEFRFPLATETETEVETETDSVLGYPDGGGGRPRKGSGGMGGTYRRGCPASRPRDPGIWGCLHRAHLKTAPAWVATALVLIAALGQLLTFSLPLWAANSANFTHFTTLRSDPLVRSGWVEPHCNQLDPQDGQAPIQGPASIVHVKFKPSPPGLTQDAQTSPNSDSGLTTDEEELLKATQASESLQNSPNSPPMEPKQSPGGDQDNAEVLKPTLEPHETDKDGRSRTGSRSRYGTDVETSVAARQPTGGARDASRSVTSSTPVTLGLWNVCRHGVCQMACFQKLPGWFRVVQAFNSIGLLLCLMTSALAVCQIALPNCKDKYLAFGGAGVVLLIGETCTLTSIAVFGHNISRDRDLVGETLHVTWSFYVGIVSVVAGVLAATLLFCESHITHNDKSTYFDIDHEDLEEETVRLS